MNERDWQILLSAIGEGKVVPIVGRDLLVVDSPEGPRPFYRMVASELAQELGIPTENLPADFDANDVACADKDFHGNPPGLNAAVFDILTRLKPPMPEALKLLAEIPNLRLFLSTTVDTLLEDAIEKVRGCPPAVVSFPPASDLLDYDEAQIKTQGSMVFHILGQVSTSSPFAVTEGQMLEQMHDFMTGNARPQKLIAKLQQSHLLILGVSFPDWLARFLLRIARSGPLWDTRWVTEVFADRRSQQKDFSAFLAYFSPRQSHIYSEGSPVDFVRELNRRWFQKNPRGDAKPAAPADGLSKWTPGSVFISYASEDQAAAWRLADELSKANLEVWVDRRLKPGDDFREIINYHIQECCAFVAVLSKNTNVEEGPGRWFRDEWSQARDLNRRYTGTERTFLFPVVVDDTPAEALNAIRRNVFERSAVNAKGGNPPPDLIAELDTAQRAYRKQAPRP